MNLKELKDLIDLHKINIKQGFDKTINQLKKHLTTDKVMKARVLLSQLDYFFEDKSYENDYAGVYESRSKIGKLLEVGPQFRTTSKVNNGSKHIRHLLQNGQARIKQMLDTENSIPCPADEQSRRNLNMVSEKLNECIRKVKEVKDKRSK